MSLRDEMFRTFTAEGIAPRPGRCHLRFKEENYSETKWDRTMELSLTGHEVLPLKQQPLKLYI
jgi:hypothetical protein